MLANLVKVRAVVQSHVAKVDEERLTQFLYAAAQGNGSIIRQVSPAACPEPAAAAIPVRSWHLGFDEHENL